MPKLRFPEFQDTEVWVLKNGSDLFDQVSNKNHDSTLPILSITQEHGAIPRANIDYHVSVSKKSIESYKVVEVGDFIISLRSFQGGIEYSKYKGLCSPAYIILRSKNSEYNAYFKQLFKTNRFIKKLNKNLEGMRDGKMVSYEQFSNLFLPIPSSLAEQQKIADCFYSIDKLILAESKKLETLRDYKKGLMQQLFPNKGEISPKLRFPEFQGARGWKTEELGKISIFVKEKILSNTLSTKNYVSTKNILQDYDGISEASRLPTTNSVTSFIKKDILISNIRPYLKKIWFSDIDGGSSNDVVVVRAKEKISSLFLGFQLKNDAFISYVMKGAKGVKMPRGDISLMKKYHIFYPSYVEQKKISACLSSIDELIVAERQKLEALQDHKKGLMQRLFPPAEEVMK